MGAAATTAVGGCLIPPALALEFIAADLFCFDASTPPAFYLLLLVLLLALFP